METAGISRRALIVALAVAVSGLLIAGPSAGLLRWLGTAAVLTAGAPLVALGRRAAWWQQRRERLPLVLLIALGVLLLGPLLAGDPPASRDHGIHYFQIRLLVEELLPSGRLWGWSNSLNNGYPYGESYPVLGYLWMAAAHLLSFGLISLRTSYAWGLAALWMLSAAVAWWLASSVSRELWGDADEGRSTSARSVAGWAGLAAAAAWLLDPGASRQGGWNYLMFHGVWPQLLAATLWAGSLGLTWRALRQPSPRRLALAVLALGGSLWAHPFGLLTATASAMAFVVVILAVPRARAWPRPWMSWAIVHLGAAVLGAAWLSTFFASAESMARAPVPWTSLGDLGSQLLQGQLLQGHWLWTGPLAVIGLGAGLRRGGAKAILVLGLVAVLLLLGSEEAITILRLDLVLSGFKNLQFPRYAIPLKPLWFALAGVGVGQVLQWQRRHRERDPSDDPAAAWTRAAWIRRAAIALLLAPLVASVVPQASRLVARPIAAIDTLPGEELAQAEAQMLAALEKEAQALPPERPLTVALMREGMTGATYPVFTIADAGGRLALDSHIPTVNFKHRLRRRPAAYASIGVTHVIHDRAVPDDEDLLAAALTPVGSFGPFTLERFAPPLDRPRRVAELRGGGRMEIVDEQTERVEVEVTEVGARTRLVFGRPPHNRWEITLDGEPLEHEARALDNHGLAGMEVVVPHPGRVVAQYVVSEQERRAAWFSAAMLLLCLGALALGRPLATQAPTDRARLVAWIVVGVGAVALVLGVAHRQQRKLEETWIEVATALLEPEAANDDDHEPRSRFVRDLVVDDALRLEQDPTHVCSGLLGKDVLEGCSEAAHAPGPSFLYRNPYLHRCLRFSLPPHGNATLHLPPLPDDEHVAVGAVIRHVRRGSGKRVRWGIAREARGPLLDARHDFTIERAPNGTTPTLVFRNDGTRIEEICIALAEVIRP